MSQKEVLMQRVAALEKKIGTASQGSSRTSLIAEIEDLEKQVTAGDEDEADEVECACKASLADPNGIEEQITQDKFTEVEGERHGEELATDDSMLAVGRQVGHSAVASEDYVARLMKASDRLDRVASYLEKNGRRSLAFKVDRIADAVDARINNIQGRK